jgi:hypothetical protein
MPDTARNGKCLIALGVIFAASKFAAVQDVPHVSAATAGNSSFRAWGGALKAGPVQKKSLKARVL